MIVAHLLASPFYGGLERQLLGLASHLPARFQSVFFTFPERGLCQPFLDEAHRRGLQASALTSNFPAIGKCVAEIARKLEAANADVLICSGYKPDIIGYFAARRAKVPVISISHGWTGATWKVRVYEALDRLILRGMDQVVCVSQAQADKVRGLGISESKGIVIRNAVGPEAFAPADPVYGTKLRSMFSWQPRMIVGSAGRLSPEKGFDQLVESAAHVVRERPDVGFVHFGNGPLQSAIERRIRELHLERNFILAGFHGDVAKYLPHLTLGVLPSFTEGLPVVVLETFAGGVPVVATRVGGTPEVIDDGENGYLVPPRDPELLARRMLDLLNDESRRLRMGIAARVKVMRDFTFTTQSSAYEQLFLKYSHRLAQTPRSLGIGERGACVTNARNAHLTSTEG